MLKKTLLTGIACAALISGMMPLPATANSLDDNGVVRSTNGNIVHSLGSGKCVRTMWESGSDICAPAPAPAPTVRVVEVPHRTLENAEKSVYFEFDSAALSAAEMQHLNGMAQILKTAEDVQRVDIVGHADRMGSNSYNRTLSEKRASSVEHYLNQQGYRNTRVTNTSGIGETAPITQCDASQPRSMQIACLRPDRRVDIAVRYIENKPKTAMIVTE